MRDPLDQLDRLAPVVDDQAAFATFSSERVRRRRARRRLAAVAALLFVVLASLPALVGLLDRDETTVAADGRDPSGGDEGAAGSAPFAFEVLAVLQTNQEMGTMRAALDAESYAEMWASFGEQPIAAPEVGGSTFVLAITIPDDACPPTLQQFITDENAFVPVFVEPNVACNQPLIPKTFLVSVARARLSGLVVFRLPANDGYDLPAFELVIDLEAGTIAGDDPSGSVRAPDESNLPGKPVDIYPYRGAELAAVGLADGEFLAVHELPTDRSGVAAELTWNDTGIVATGRNRQVDNRMWSEVRFRGATGWAPSESLLQPLARHDEIIDQLFPNPSDRPTHSDIGALALMVVNAFGQEPYSRVATFDHPEDSTAASSVRIDIVGIGDDATGGVRLHITAAARSDHLVLTSVERIQLCSRGVSDRGCL